MDKVYYAKIEGMLPEDAKDRMEGWILEQNEALLLEVSFFEVTPSSMSEIRLTIHEGKFHQVKRCLNTRCHVVYQEVIHGDASCSMWTEAGEIPPLTHEELETKTKSE